MRPSSVARGSGCGLAQVQLVLPRRSRNRGQDVGRGRPGDPMADVTFNMLMWRLLCDNDVARKNEGLNSTLPEHPTEGELTATSIRRARRGTRTDVD